MSSIGCWGFCKSINCEVEREAERLSNGKRVSLRCLTCKQSIPKVLSAFLSKATWHLETLGEIFTSTAGSPSRTVHSNFTVWFLHVSRRNFILEDNQSSGWKRLKQLLVQGAHLEGLLGSHRLPAPLRPGHTDALVLPPKGT